MTNERRAQGRRRLRRRLWGGGLGLGLLAFAVAGSWPVDPHLFDRPAGATLVDRDGVVLRRSGDGARWTPLDRIAPALVEATIASEDHRFYQHHGVDGLGLVRAAWLDLRALRPAYGGSTITMQLAKRLEARPRGLSRDLAKILLALRIERRLGKREILEQYLNRVYYGNRATGAEAAAQTYFGKPAADLSLAEATLLAALPRAPEAYDPYRNLPRALARRSHILGLLAKRGRVSAEEAAAAEREPLQLAHAAATPLLAPHFCDHVLAELEARRAAGAAPAAPTVVTTLDAALQRRLERALASHLSTLRAEHVTQAGLLVLETPTGAVRALIGSAGYFDAAHAGAVDIALVRRSPGSALKPFLYALALERGDAPSSVAYDVAIDRPGAPTPHNADGREHGPVRYRDALGSSLNLAAIDVATRRVGTDALGRRLALAGLMPAGAPPPSPSIVLGSVAVRPLDLAAAFTAFARDGTAVSAYDLEDSPTAAAPRPPRRLFSPQVAWLAGDMLADPSARRPVFGEELPLDLPFRVMAKTGTSAGFADNVTVAATREWTVLAWAGNFDGSPMHGVLAMRGAAPLVRAALLALRERGPLTLPDRPPGIVSAPVCPLSGLAPGPDCPARKRELFLAGSEPHQRCRWHRPGGAIAWPPEVTEWAARRAAPEVATLAPAR